MSRRSGADIYWDFLAEDRHDATGGYGGTGNLDVYCHGEVFGFVRVMVDSDGSLKFRAWLGAPSQFTDALFVRTARTWEVAISTAILRHQKTCSGKELGT